MPASREVLADSCGVFGLGRLQTAEAVAGGLSNELWRVETDTGRYAVKVMRTNADRPDFRTNIEHAFAIEERAYRAGVRCPRPVPAPSGGCLIDVAGLFVRIHEWVDGTAPDPVAARPLLAPLLAGIHAASPQLSQPVEDEPWSADEWLALADRTQGPLLAARLAAASPALADLESVTSAQGLAVTWVDTHGDLDPKNTLLVSGHLLALDWDAAQPEPAAREAAAMALDWTTDPQAFAQVVAAYRAQSPQPVPAQPWVLGGWVSALGGWLIHNAERSEDHPRHGREATSALERLMHLQVRLPDYVDALRTR
jgi:Ser/Thr protein kinase RdoA (MazF antagonist)